MDKETIARFKRLLEEEKQRILKNAKTAIEELSGKTEDTSGDEGDQARNLAEMHLSLRFKERERHLLRKIESALERIKEGSFGICENCDEEIGLKRLEIRPVATLCISCKETQERYEKGFSSETQPSGL
jgi:DnaK suppressor protein